MPDYMYLIVGGGMTTDAAVHGIREVDRTGSIGLLSADGHPPYDRPPLSKKLWKGKPLESIWRQTESQGATLHLGRRARHLDPQNKRITDDQGTAYGYDKLLLATGGTPRRLPFGGEQIIYFRTLKCDHRLGVGICASHTEDAVAARLDLALRRMAVAPLTPAISRAAPAPPSHEVSQYF